MVDNTNNSAIKRNIFLLPFILILLFAFVELFSGFWSQSLALISDAWHMFTDAFALGLAMFAAYRTQKTQHAQHDHGPTRTELMVSSINALLMLVVIVWIVMEAFERFNHPQLIHSASVMGVALVGLVVNLIVAKQLHGHGHGHGHHHHGHVDASDDLNYRAAFLHVLGDILGSVAALLSGLIIYLTGWMPIDAILSVLIALILLASTANLIKDIWQALREKKHSKHQGHHH